MTFQELIQKRQSIRKYQDKPVEKEKLDRILEAGRLAPSAKNDQDWKFIMVTDEKTRAAICKGIPQDFAKQAPVLLLGCGKKEALPMRCGQPRNAIDLGIATAFMHLQLTELGLGACWMGNFEADVAAEAVGLEEDMTVLTVSTVGYAAEKPPRKARKAHDEVCFYK